jgi:peptidoglycan/LPS O-acetylase OafA/YrhL
MTLSHASPGLQRSVRTRPAPSARVTRRDAAVDLGRAGALVAVVLLHALMVGVSTGPAGPVLVNAMEAWPGFAALSWLVQVMPLFFLLGGFSSFTQWTRMRDRGAGYGDYLATRLRRLFVPGVAAFAATAVLLSAVNLSGAPADIVAVAGFRIGQPLWFLGVYVLCTVAVPPMVALHVRAPVVGLAAPAALAVAVDVVRGATGVPALGYANLVFVWLAVQQLGFWFASGRFDRLSRGRLMLVAVSAACVLAVVCSTGAWSFDMLANLNPPTPALMVLAVVQLAGFLLLAPALRRVAARPVARVSVDWISARAMTVYLWHMPAVIALAGALLLSGVPLPVPLSADWWLSRPLWFASVLAVVGIVVVAAGRFEGSTHAAGDRPLGLVRTLVAAVAGAGGVVLALLGGSALAAWVAGAALLFLALRILRGSGRAGAGTR